MLLTHAENVVVGNQLKQLEEFRRTRDSWEPAWANAAFSADFLLRLSPHQLGALYQALEAVIQSFEKRSVSTDSEDDESVMVLIHGFPIRSTQQ